MKLEYLQKQTWKLFFQNWFCNNQNYVVSEQCYIYHLMDELYDFIQQKYKEDNIQTITLYRWESNIRKQKVLSSWTPNKSDIEFYKNKYNGEGCLIVKNINVEQILFDTKYMDDLFEAYETSWDEIIGIVGSDECIVIDENMKWLYYKNAE